MMAIRRVAGTTVPVAPDAHPRAAERGALRLAATLLFGGELLTLVAGVFHPDREPANHHAAVFAEYADSAQWTLIHLGQFAGMAVIVAGLLALFVALRAGRGGAGWLGRFAAVSAGAALGLYAVLQAVDGVALKQAVDAWVRAPEAEKAARFATAEAVRWLEWGVRSYQSFTLGFSLLLFAAAVVSTARVPRPIGFLMAVSGLAYIAQGSVIRAEGFSAANDAPTLLGYASMLMWSSWLLASAWRMPVIEATRRSTRKVS
jgi:hypothetical protein